MTMRIFSHVKYLILRYLVYGVSSLLFLHCFAFFFFLSGYHRDLHVLTHSFPTRRSFDLMGLKIVADKKQPSLVIVHRKQLLDQWVDRIEAFLGIPKKEVGTIGQGKMKLGTKITVATIQSLPKYLENIWEKFGRSEEHTSELQSLMRISYAVFCLKK